MRFLFTAFVLTLFSGCATLPASAPAYTRASEAPSGQANVYIYRVGAYPSLRTPKIMIDGVAIIDPPEKAYTFISLPAGTHEFVVNWAWDTGWPDLKFPITVVAGMPLYIKISGRFEPNGTGYTAGSIARVVSPAEAEQELSTCCRYMAPHTKK